jgi:hypothetical protein
MAVNYYPIKLKLYQSASAGTEAASIEYSSGTSQTLLKAATSGTFVLDSSTVYLGDKTGAGQSLQARLSSLETSIIGLTGFATKTQVNGVGDEIAGKLTALQTRIYNIENVVNNHLDLPSVGDNTAISITDI